MLLHSFNRLIPFFYVHSSFLISIRHLTSRYSSHHLLLSLSFIRSCATLRVRARLYGVGARLCAVLARLCALMRDFTRLWRDCARWCGALRVWWAMMGGGARHFGGSGP